MKTWKVTMEVNGVVKIEFIEAESMRAAQDIFRQMYRGSQTVLISTTLA